MNQRSLQVVEDWYQTHLTDPGMIEMAFTVGLIREAELGSVTAQCYDPVSRALIASNVVINVELGALGRRLNDMIGKHWDLHGFPLGGWEPFRSGPG